LVGAQERGVLVGELRFQPDLACGGIFIALDVFLIVNLILGSIKIF
jgi:hypothetical protein